AAEPAATEPQEPAVSAAAGEAPPPGEAPVEASDLEIDVAAELSGVSEAAPAEQDVEDTHGYLKGLVEALLFVADRPLTVKELARAAKIDRKRTGELLEELRLDYESRGMRIESVAEGFAFRSNPAYGTYVRSFLAQRPIRLSRAQLETMAIIA